MVARNGREASSGQCIRTAPAEIFRKCKQDKETRDGATGDQGGRAGGRKASWYRSRHWIRSRDPGRLNFGALSIKLY
jgi:hypothetical protein